MAADFIITVGFFGTSARFSRVIRLWSPQLYFLNRVSLRLTCSIIIVSTSKLLEYKGDQKTDGR